MLPLEVQQHNINQAVRLFSKGKNRSEIVGVHYIVVCKWIRTWKDDGPQCQGRYRMN